MNRKTNRISCLGTLLLLSLLLPSGCRNDTTSSIPSDTTNDPASQAAQEGPRDERYRPLHKDPEMTPRRLLERSVAAYKKARSYSDHGMIRIIGRMENSEAEPTPWPCTVAWQAPGRLRLEVNDGMLVSDGDDCFAQVRSMPGQVLHFPTPEHWTLETLFRDVRLDQAMDLGIPGSILRFPPQLILLFAEDPLKTLLPEGAEAEMLPPQWLKESPCDLVRITHPAGNRVLWICRDDGALLRLDYLVEELSVPEGFQSIRSIRLDLGDAQFDREIAPEAFQMLQPGHARRVAQFQPTETLLLGHEIPSPERIRLRTIPGKSSGGQDVPLLEPTFASLLEKTVVLCFWTGWSDASGPALREVLEVRNMFSGDDRILFFNVNRDKPDSAEDETRDPNQDSETLRETRRVLQNWDLDIEIREDVGGMLAQSLQVDSFPTIVVLAPSGRVDFYFRGIVAASYLEKTIREILLDEKPYQRILASIDRERKEHLEMLHKMSREDRYLVDPEPEESGSRRPPAPPRAPARFSLEQRWSLPVAAPGNIAVLKRKPGEPTKMLALCEGNMTVLFDLSGKLVQQVRPEGVHHEELLALLRVADDGLGKTRVGLSSVSGHAVRVFDENLKPILSCPTGEDRVAQIVSDFQFVDLDGNGAMGLLMGFIALDDSGEEGDSLRVYGIEGEEIWRDDTVSSPFQVQRFLQDGRRGLFCLDVRDSRSVILKFDMQGKRWEPFDVDARFQVLWFQVAEFSDDSTGSICTILDDSRLERLCVAALDPEGRILWQHPLPEGRYQNAIERVFAADLLGDTEKEWIVSAPDGMILVLSRRGELLDSFSFGELPTGLAVVSDESKRMLVVAAESGIVAWEVLPYDHDDRGD